jgi:hypothetical protein
MFEVDGKKVEHLSISVTVRRVTSEIKNILVPIDEEVMSIDNEGNSKLSAEKLFEKALIIAKDGKDNEDWYQKEINFELNEKQIPSEEINILS